MKKIAIQRQPRKSIDLLVGFVCLFVCLFVCYNETQKQQILFKNEVSTNNIHCFLLYDWYLGTDIVTGMSSDK